MHDLILGMARVFDGAPPLYSPRLYCQRFQRQLWGCAWTVQLEYCVCPKCHRGRLTKSIDARMPRRATKKRLNLLFL